MNSVDGGDKEGLSNNTNTTTSSSFQQQEEIPIRPINYLSDDYLSNILHSIQRNHSSATTNPTSSSSTLVVLRGGIFSHMIYSLLSKYWISSSSILKAIYKEEQRRNNHQFSSSSSGGGGDQESSTNQHRKQDILNSFEQELKSQFISILSSSHSSKLKQILRSSSTLILLKELKFWHFFESFDDEIILRGFYFVVVFGREGMVLCVSSLSVFIHSINLPIYFTFFLFCFSCLDFFLIILKMNYLYCESLFDPPPPSSDQSNQHQNQEDDDHLLIGINSYFSNYLSSQQVFFIF